MSGQDLPDIWVADLPYDVDDGWPVLHGLDREASEGAEVPDRPGFMTAPKRLVLRERPTEPVFRLRGYPWLLVCTELGREQLRKGHGQRLRFFPPDPLPVVEGTLDPWSLHARVADTNWDLGEPTDLIRSPTCDLASAQVAYWSGGAEYYLKFMTREAIESFNVPGWDLHAEIEARVRAGSFLRGYVAHDPAAYGDPRAVAQRERWVRAPPALLCEPTGDPPEVEVPPLHAAIQRDDVAVVRRLLEAGARREAVPPHGDPMGWAVQFGSPEVVEVLIDRGAPMVDAELKAVGTRRLDLLARLLARGGGGEMLRAAARIGWTDGVRALLDNGVDPNLLNIVNTSALSIATEADHPEVVRILLAAGARPDAGKPSTVDKACQAGDVDTLRTLLAAGAKPEMYVYAATSIWPRGEHPRHDILELLLEYAAWTPGQALLGAASNGDLDGVRLALSHGADPNESENGALPLHWAAQFGRESIVEHLLAAGADASLRDGNGQTAAEVATLEVRDRLLAPEPD